MSELSAATGVPSPFMLAFQQPVAECDAAELWVHRELEREGFRHADNREFFNAPLHEIIQVVAQAANLIFDESNLNDSGVGSPDYETNQEVLAEELYNLGCAYEKGTDSVLRNKKKALEYFEQAAALGNVDACHSAGSFYHSGTEGIRQDKEKALALYSKAAHLGRWWIESSIALIFLDSGQAAASQAHWKRFFERACKEIEREPNDLRDTMIGDRGVSYCEFVASGKLTHCVPDQNIARLAEPLLKAISIKHSELAQEPDIKFAEYMAGILRKARRFVEGKMSRKEPTGGGWSFKNLFK